MTVAPFAGSIGAIPGASPNYIFAGPTATVTITAAQKLTAVADGPLGLSANATAQLTNIGVCYQGTVGNPPPLMNFNGPNPVAAQVFPGEIHLYSASGSVTPGAGSWKVGLCVDNFLQNTISLSGNVSGWVMVTN